MKRILMSAAALAICSVAFGQNTSTVSQTGTTNGQLTLQ